MFNQLFPQRIDNTYRGHKLALWLFGLLVLMKTAMSVNAIFLGHKIATSADGIPLDTFPSAAAETIVSMFAIWGLAHLMICLLCILVLVRYEPDSLHVFVSTGGTSGQKADSSVHFHCRDRNTAGTFVNLALLAMMIVGLALSLWNPLIPSQENPADVRKAVR